MKTFDEIAADQLDQAANIVSGLDLTELGRDGHGVANTLWSIASFLRQRAARSKR